MLTKYSAKINNVNKHKQTHNTHTHIQKPKLKATKQKKAERQRKCHGVSGNVNVSKNTQCCR